MDSNSFLETRYVKTITMLIKHSLWDFETGLMLTPILQSCVPPPSIEAIKRLISELMACGINVDWAPYDILKHLTFEFSMLSNIEPSDNFQYIDYPICYGIHRIYSLADFSKPEKAQLIIKFVEIVFNNTGSRVSMTTSKYYNDIYSLRDICIQDLASKKDLTIGGNLTKNFEKKKERADQILNQNRHIGDTYGYQTLDNAFWNDPPFIAFTGQSKIRSNGQQTAKRNPYQTLQMSEIQKRITQEHDFSLLSNEFQRQTIQNTHSKWIRGNVRSHADANQLCLSAIFTYFEFLIQAKDDKYLSIFIVSLLSLATGINKKRWQKLTTDKTKRLADDNCHLDESTNSLTYKITGGATNFKKLEGEKSQQVTLKLPTSLNLTVPIIQRGIHEDSSRRAFQRKNNGISIGLNRIARSGHNLIRKLNAKENDVFLLSGSIPIEFRARHAYKATNNEELNTLFYKNLSSIHCFAKKNAKAFPKTRATLKRWLTAPHHPSSQHSVGSQLADLPQSFSGFELPSFDKRHINTALSAANALEVYFFWMLQYGLATRPISHATDSHYMDDYWLHKDKNSEFYQEKKLLRVPELVKLQYKEILSSRQTIESLCHRYHYTLQSLAQNPVLPIQYQGPSSKKVVQTKNLFAKEAQSVAATWGVKQPFNRLNAHRHQSATYIHNRLSEQHADTSLGHHIDGWFYAAPESSASISLLDEVHDAQTHWLNQLGFKHIRNPFL